MQDVDLKASQIPVRDGKGSRDRPTMLPQPVKEPLRDRLRRAKMVHEEDVADGYPREPMPDGRQEPSGPDMTGGLYRSVQKAARKGGKACTA